MKLAQLITVSVWISFYTSMFWLFYSTDCCGHGLLGFISGCTMVIGTIANIIFGVYIAIHFWDDGKDVL